MRSTSERGISLVGRDGLLGRVTKLVLEGELTDHLGYPHGDPAGRNAATPATAPATRP